MTETPGPAAQALRRPDRPRPAATSATSADRPGPRSAELYPESAMNELLLSGCRADQYSYDARFGRTFHGAMTQLRPRHSSPPPATGSRTRQLHRQLVPALRDANYDQEPQLEGRDGVQAPADVHVTCADDRRTARPHRHRRHLRRRAAGGHATAPSTSAPTGTIDAVQPRRRRPPAGFERARRVATGGVDHAGAHRPPQPPRLQHPAAVVGAARHAVHEPPPVAGRGDVRPRRLQPGAGAGHRRRRGRAALRRGARRPPAGSRRSRARRR